MANTNLIDGIKRNVENLKNDDFKVFSIEGGRVQPWQNQTPEEIELLIEDTLNVLGISIEEGLLITVPFNILNAINTQLNTFYTQYAAIKSLTAEQLQNQHHNPLNQLQATNQQLRNSGVYALSVLGPDIEVKRASIDEQLSKVSQANADILKLQEQIKTLINPAAADSLSSAFDERRKKISVQKWIWAVIVGVSVAIAMFATYDITDSIGQLVKEITNGKSTTNSEKNSVDPNDIPLVWFMRVLLLAPSYLLVFFSFKQYVRERMLEENYAHKSAIAQTLPSYSELVTDEKVRDEITSSATKVAFELPRSNDEKTSSLNLTSDKLSDFSNKIEKLIKLNGKTMP